MPSLFPDLLFQFPQFNALLVVGQYHPSAPIHLALSYATENPDVSPLILSPSRPSFKNALTAFNDNWIATKARRGNQLEPLSRIEMLYPPTPVHLSLLLAMLRCSSEGDPENSTSLLNPKTNRTFSPGLLILHEPSLYFADADELSPHTVSSYLGLVTRTFAAIQSLSRTGAPGLTSFALFDSRLLELKLPITKIPSSDIYRYQGRDSPQLESVFNSTEKYFEWVAHFEPAEDEDTIPSSQGEDENLEELHRPSKQMKLYRIGAEQEAQVIRWEETIRAGLNNAPPTTYFEF